MAYWMIEPHESTDYDVCILPGDTDEDHQLALQYATKVLEKLWDEIEDMESRTLTIQWCNKPVPERFGFVWADTSKIKALEGK